MPKTIHSRASFSRTLMRHTLRGFVVLMLLAFLTPVYTYTREYLQPKQAIAAPGINRQINFQGKLVNPDGTNVTNGSYSIVFSIYSVSSGGTAIWTETQSVSLLNGIFQVDLGSVTALPGAVDFDTDNIYLGVKVGSDAEMTPRIRFTAVPQAFNAERLGGLDKTGFIQNTTSQQTANFNVSGTGVVGTSLTTPILQSGAGVGLTITGNAASTWSTTAGNLTLQTGGTGNIILNSAGVIDLQDSLQNSTGDLVLNDQVQLGGATGLQITTAGVITDIDGASVVIGENLSVTAGGASIVGNTTIATTAGNTLSLGNSTGALTVTGSSASTFVLNGVTVDTTEFNRLDGKDAALVDTNDAVNTAITGTGALNVGSITTGFGAIDVGTDNITTTGVLNGGTLTVTGNATFDTNTLFVDSTNNRVGIGTTAPNTALDVSGVISRAQNSTRVYKNVYTYNIGSSGQTGTIILTAPKGFTSTMLRFTIKGYDYASTTGAWEAVVGGYAYAPTPAWINTSTEIRGNAPFSSVRLGYDGTNVVIMLGTTTTVWQYPKVVIEEIVAGHSSVDDWGGAWSGALVTNETTPIAYANIVTPPVRSPFLQGGNTFGATATLGTNDSQSLVLETADTARLTITSTGAATFSGSLQASAGLTVASGASIQGNTTIATTAGNTLSLGNSTGALTVTGSSASTFVLNGVTVDTTEFNRLDGKDAALVDANDSLTSTFGTIDTGDTITGTTLNGTTGINTGAGAGTQRIDASGNLVNVGNITATGNLVLQGRTIQLSNFYPEYRWRLANNNTDVNWKKLADISIGTGTYRAASFQVDVTDANCNYGCSSNAIPMRFYASAHRSGAVQDDQDTGSVAGPSTDYVRLVKTATGVYELQGRSLNSWRTLDFTVRQLSGSGETITYATTPADGSTVGTIYNSSTTGYTQDFANADVNGNFSVVGTASIQGTANVNGDILGNNKIAFRTNDSWLRLNPTNAFTAGTYAGTGIFRTDGNLQVGASGASFNVTSTGVTTIAGGVTLSVASGTALNISNTGVVTDLNLQNGETIDNDTDGTIRLTATNTNITGNLMTNGTQRLSSTGVLSNVSHADAGNFFTGGAVTVARGGTGTSTFTTNGVLYGNGTGAVQTTAAGSTGQCLVATTGSAPTWGTCAAGAASLSGNNTFTGTNLFQPSTNSATAVQIQNNTGINLFTADTQNMQLTVSGGAQATFVRALGSAAGIEIAYDTHQTSDGGYVVTGVSNGYGAGGYDVFLQKYDSSGALTWNKTWGGTGDDQSYGVQQTDDGGFIVTGTTNSYGAGSYDALLLKYDAAGTLEWARTLGKTGWDQANSVTIAQDGGYVVAGLYNLNDVLIAKFSDKGVLQWNRTWGASAQTDAANDIITASDGGFVLTGYTSSYGAGNKDAFLLKFSKNGVFEWNKTWGGTGDDTGSSIVQAGDGGLVIAGQTASFGAGSDDMFIAKYTSSGTLSWNKVWGGTGQDVGRALAKNTQGYAVTGHTTTYGGGGQDIFTVQYDTTGSVIWSKSFGGASNDSGLAATAPVGGGVVIAGRTDTYGAGAGDVLLAKYTDLGAISGCSSPQCQTILASTATPSATNGTPTAALHTQVLTIESLTGSVSTPSSTATAVVALSSAYQALRVVGGGSYSGDLTISSGSAMAQTTINAPTYKGTGVFSARADYASNLNGYDVIGADFNNDGATDVVAANWSAGNVSFLKNNGDGTLAAKVDTTVVADTYMLDHADFNGDGNEDLVVTSGSAQNVYVMMGNGNGTFGAATAYAHSSVAYGVSAADVDGDGDIDFVATRSTASGVGVYLNNGNGTFAARVDYGTAASPYEVMLADVDGDGDKDMTVANRSSNSVSVLMNNGNGTFAAKVDYATAPLPQAVEVVDLDGDGDRDIAVASGSNFVSILKNNGNGTFAAKVDYATDESWSINGGDIDGDGDLDLVTASASDNSIAVFRNNGDATFGTKTDYDLGFNTFSAKFIDLNMDGVLDLVVRSTGSTVAVLLNPTVAVVESSKIQQTAGKLQIAADADKNGILLQGAEGQQANLFQAQDSAGNLLAALSAEGDLALGSSKVYRITTAASSAVTGWSTPVAYSIAGSAPGVAAGDLNGDGSKDLAATNGTAAVSVLMNNGNGTYATKVDYTTGSSSYGVAIGDIDNDGDRDMAVTNNTATSVSILRNNGNGTFAAKVDYTVGTNPRRVVLSDLDNDGDRDMAVTNNGSNTVSVLLNNGSGTFAAKVDYTITSSPDTVISEDFDGDGDNDLAVTKLSTSYAVSILLNNGNGTFAAAVNYTTADFPEDVAAGDLDGDGDKDLAVAGRSSNVISILLNNGNGTFAAKVDYSMSYQPYSVALADVNGDFRLDIIAGARDISNSAGRLMQFIGNGDGTFGTSSVINTPVDPEQPYSLAVDDLDGDTFPDVAYPAINTNSIQVALNAYSPATAAQAGSGMLSVKVKDSSTGGLYLQGATGQASPYLNIQNADGNDIFLIDAEGNTSVTGKLSVVANDASGYVATISNTDTTNNADGLLIKLGVANTNRGTGNYFIGFADSAGTVAGKIQGGTSAVAYTTSAADYAEYFRADPNDLPQPGELVTLDQVRENGVRRASGSDLAVGIISTNPGFVGNGPICQQGDNDCDKNYAKTNVLVSLVGQVPLKVTGEVKTGDALGASDIPGVAKAVTSGTIVGYALTSAKDGVVQVLIRSGSLEVGGVNGIQGGDGVFTSLAVTGEARITNLVVTGSARIEGNLTVIGDIETANIKINGHIVTGGSAPAVAAGQGAGIADTLNNIAAPDIKIEGNDTSGTITIKVGANAAADELAKITFAQAFTGKPRVILSPADRDAARLGAYYDSIGADLNGFRIMSDLAPEAGKTYTFTYFVVQ